MLALHLLALGSGIGDTLTWLAFFGLAGLALVLYIPQRFSGPLTAHERAAIRGGRRHRTIAVVLAAPMATLAGFFLLLPPLVELHVPSHATQTNASAMAQLDRSGWSWLSSRESTWEWTRSVRCHLAGGVRGEAALVDAILAAADDGFDVEGGCALADVDAWELASIELSLVEIAARAYILSDVLVSAGPRLHDPDPWDVMDRSLQARGIRAHFTKRDQDRDAHGNEILRLTRARLSDDRPSPVEALALIKGDPCASFPAKLIAMDGAVLDRCTLSAIDCRGSADQDQRMLQVRVAGCGEFTTPQSFTARRGGILLVAGHGETPVRMSDRLEPLEVSVDGPQDMLKEALAQSGGEPGAFTDELKQRALRGLRVESEAEVRIRLGLQDIEVRGPASLPEHCDIPVEHGPFSWVGLENKRPEIEARHDHIRIRTSANLLDREHAGYDPTAVYALLSTITWAANALDSGVCGEREEPPWISERRPAYPLLNTAQLDVAVGALRRGRDSLGLVLLAVAVLSLALSLRRSVR